jgi:hypothetical protein
MHRPDDTHNCLGEIRKLFIIAASRVVEDDIRVVWSRKFFYFTDHGFFT